MNSTPVSLYRILNEKPVLVGALTHIVFEPGALPSVMQNVVSDITPVMRQEELRHVLTFDCPRMPAVAEVHVIEVGTHFLLRVEEFIAANCSGSGPAHCSAYVSLLALGPLRKNEEKGYQTAREQRAGCVLNSMRLLRSTSPVVQKGSLHARPHVSHR